MVSFMELAAKKKLNIHQDQAMKMLSVESIAGGFLVHMCPTTTYQRGDRKGSPKYNIKQKVPVLLLDADVLEQQTKFESETGKCYVCQGSGKKWIGWSKTEGSKFVLCTRCNGTGAI